MSLLPELPDEAEAVALGPDPALEGFGTWSETDNASDLDGPLGTGTRRIRWAGTVRPEAMPAQSLDLAYSYVIYESEGPLGEREAWDRMNEWVRQTAHGSGFLPRTTEREAIEREVLDEIGRWDLLKPEDADLRVGRAIQAGATQYQLDVKRLRALGGDPESPSNGLAGWMVPVVPWSRQRR